MDVLGLLLSPPEAFGLAPFVVSKRGPLSKLELRQGPVPEPKPSPAATIARAKYLQTKWPDAAKAQLSAAWKTFAAKAPSEEMIIRQVAGTAAEQASASMLKVFDLVALGVNQTIGMAPIGEKATAAAAAAAEKSKLKAESDAWKASQMFRTKAERGPAKSSKLILPTAALSTSIQEFERSTITDPSAAGRARGQAALEQMKSAMTSAGGIDPTSQKAFSFIESVLTGTPITAGLNAAQSLAAKEINTLLGTSKELEPLLRKVTGLYTNLHGTAKAVATLLLAGAVGAGGIAMGVGPVYDESGNKKKGSYTFTPPPLVLAQIAPWVPDIGLDSFTIDGGELRQLSGSLTQAIGKTGVSATAGATFLKTVPKAGPATESYTQKAGLLYSQDHGRFSTQASIQAALDEQQRLSASAKASVGIKTGRKKNVDTRAWAEGNLSAQGKASGAAGAQVSVPFGATPAERKLLKAQRKAAREERRAIRRRYRANPAVVQKLAGPLPSLRRMFPPGATPQPYLDPPSAGFPWGLALGAGALGLGVLGWMQRERLAAAFAR